MEEGQNWKKLENEDEQSPVEEVRLTVPTDDDPSVPVWTFRMWFLGIISCALLSFINIFFSYRQNPLIISMITAQVASLPLGRLMAKVLPTRKFHLPGFGSREFSLNPGPFSMKEHVLISIFANAGAGFGGGTAYAISIVDIIKVFYHRKISFLAGWILVITTQVLGYGWAGIMRKYVVEPAEMWWPSTLVQVSIFRALHEKDNSGNYSRGKFFLIVMTCSFTWYIVPGYLFKTLSTVSVLCLAFRKSVLAHQLGSGQNGLGILSFTFDWSVVAYLTSPLVTPFFAILNILVGYVIIVYIMIPAAYWGFNLYNANKFPLFSTNLFDANGQKYNVSAIVNDKFEIDMPTYEKQGRINLSIMFALSYGLSFATIVATLTHVILFNGREIYGRFRASYKGKTDIHTRLMRKYNDIPSWWFHTILVLSFALSLVLCTVLKSEIQLPWWGLIFACGIALIFTLPISIIQATTNNSPGLNVITEYIIGLIIPGKPIANVCFKTYGYISMAQAVSFLQDFKLGHYMKIPPRSMFVVQLVGTFIAATINMASAWYMLTHVPFICQLDSLPKGSPWTCRGDHVFYDASVIWGLVGPKRFFGPLGNYGALNWFFLGGAIAPILVWLLHKSFPKQSWIKLINIPVLLGATAAMPPASTLNFNSWFVIGTLFNFIIFQYRKKWWQRYNYVLSAALDAGLAFMGVFIYLFFGLTNHENINWWGNVEDYCDLAKCPTAKGIQVDGCPLL
ncbi:oligopeptide transporter 4-like [Nicotiana tomentosiformis]|uniref:oligopeptide transporter 4-like n=1 Tax=Nicotiana tomentosiformis TaxID=4098 RepID=UPI00051B8EF8|nr:oligopeptide transporter 4-like [Nicotiana tomentosiformis]